MNYFRTDTDIKKAFEDAFDATGEATQEKVDAAVRSVRDQAEELFGSAGIYVTGALDIDTQCAFFRFKRPGIGQRVQHAIPCIVPRAEEEDPSEEEDDQLDLLDEEPVDDNPPEED